MHQQPVEFNLLDTCNFTHQCIHAQTHIYEDASTHDCIDLLPVWQMSHSCAMNRCDVAVIRRIIFRLELNEEWTLVYW